MEDPGDRGAEVPAEIPGWFGVDEAGRPAIAGRYFLKIAWPFRLADGRIAAVYGAEAELVEATAPVVPPALASPIAAEQPQPIPGK